MHRFSPDRIALHLTPAALRAVRRNHPWVYAQGIARQNKPGAAGDLAVLFDRNRAFVGLGLYDPDSPIRVRVLHQGEQTIVDREWLCTRLQQSFDRRAELCRDATTNAFRLVHGENDRLPGIVVDQYDETYVIKLDTAAWLPHLPVVIELLQELGAPRRIVLRLSRKTAKSSLAQQKLVDGSILAGLTPERPLTFMENGICFEVDPFAGQKTGFFLDQRENRRRVELLSKGRDVLNVFSYTGGFSLYAARGGASRVVSLDASAPALAAAQRNALLNPNILEASGTRLETMCADAFQAMEQMHLAGRRFGLVILDPPSFAHKQEDVDKAVAAYERLARLGLRVLQRRGILVAASCSARVPAEVFFQTIQRAASHCRRDLQIMEKTAHASDHPIGFPEGAYLKCLFATVL